MFSALQMWSTLTQHFSCGRMGLAWVGVWHSRWVYLKHTWVKSAPMNTFHVSEGKAGWWRWGCFVCCCLWEAWPCSGTGKAPLANATANTELVEMQGSGLRVPNEREGPLRWKHLLQIQLWPSQLLLLVLIPSICSSEPKPSLTYSRWVSL